MNKEADATQVIDILSQRYAEQNAELIKENAILTSLVSQYQKEEDKE